MPTWTRQTFVPAKTAHSWLLVVGGGGAENTGDLRIATPTTTTRPEDTRGGAMVAGFAFCANDMHDDCPGITPPSDLEAQFSGAESALWAGIYQMFAKQVRGQLSIAILQPEADTSVVVKAAIPNLRPESVSETNIFVKGKDCHASRQVAQVRDALEKMGITKITCVQDPFLLQLAFCAGKAASTESCALVKRTSEEAQKSETTQRINGDGSDETETEQTRSHIWWVTSFCVLLIVAASGVGFVLRKRRTRKKDYDMIPHSRTDQ